MARTRVGQSQIQKPYDGEGLRAVNFADPLVPTDLTTKQYVDGLGETVLEINSELAKSVTGMNEELVAQHAVNFDVMAPVDNIIVILTSFTKQSGGAMGTYRVRIGGTYGVADGLDVCQLDTTHAAFIFQPDVQVGGGTPKPSGSQLVKLTARASLPGAAAQVRHYNIAFQAV
jgi:hypothetical protein